MLAAAGPDAIVLPEGDGGASELSAYWLARHPEDRVVVIEDFFDRAAEATPPQLALGESRFVAADMLLAAARPADGFEGIAGTVVEIDARVFPPREPEHGGGAGFSPLGFGGIGEGLEPILEQNPTVPPLGPPPPTIDRLPPTDGNRAPVANDDLAATFRGVPITIDPLANDFDPDPGDAIEVVRAELLLEVAVAQPGAQSSGAATASPMAVGGEGGGRDRRRQHDRVHAEPRVQRDRDAPLRHLGRPHRIRAGDHLRGGCSQQSGAGRQSGSRGDARRYAGRRRRAGQRRGSGQHPEQPPAAPDPPDHRKYRRWPRPWRREHHRHPR